MNRPLVIGVGNPYRHDDGVGIVVAQRLRELGVDADVAEESGEPVGLVQRWLGRSNVTLVDAVSAGAAPGTVYRLDCTAGEWAGAPPAGAVSTHGLGLAEAVELGRALEQLPEHLVLVAVEALDVSEGVGLSPPVALAVEAVVSEVRRSFGDTGVVGVGDRGAR